MSLTSCPSLISSRAQWWALPHASMPTKQGGRLAKSSSTLLLASFLRRTGRPAASAPRTWNQFFARSSPTVVISVTDGPSCIVSRTLGTVMPQAGTVHSIEGLAGLRDRPRPGRPCALDEGRQAALKALILRGPKLERDGCVAWRARDLRGLVERRFGVRYSEAAIRRLLHGLDLSWQKARPVHPEADPRAQERLKKTCPA